ncbi:MAG TPA: tetratricopeptide repeat-containing protein [Thermoanaerobaculia bacterium]|nr:tetratricopeptide repeat-containing protein [Thermoanaerobaculia bacterium]
MIPRTFIIRPFGEKRGFDFERVETDLIGPALDAFGIEDRTTLDILRSGNIRVDMFHRLLTADLVIADLSIHNANVFYELGIRHALRRQHTILIRCPADPIPFDLFTDRYLQYDCADPAAVLETLKKSIRQTLESGVVDSPVFNLLPNLKEPDAEAFITVPRGFAEAVSRVYDSKDDVETKIADLALFGSDIRTLPWETGGLRLIGRKQFKLDKGAAARVTWERIREDHEDDVEANLTLSTIYQRLGEISASEQTVERVMNAKNTTLRDRSEALALRARNAKSRWLAQWRDIADLTDRARIAVASAALMQSHTSYFDGYMLDLHYYPGINALATAVIISELAKREEGAWQNAFDEDDDATTALVPMKQCLSELPAAIRMSVESVRRASAPKRDIWGEITLADLTYLTGTSPDRVKAQYGRLVKDQHISRFEIRAMRAQIEIFASLDLLPDRTPAALEALPIQDEEKPQPHILVFTGHRVDAPGRKEARFPQEKVEVAKAEIERALDHEMAEHGAFLIGIAGAASGGDILFHEACIARAIPSIVYLALPAESFARESVNDSGDDWTMRFYALLKTRPPRVLQETQEIPTWLATKREKLTVWQRNNLWILHRGLVHGGANMTLLALWNGKAGDGPGGTEDMVSQARSSGARVVLIGKDTIFLW